MQSALDTVYHPEGYNLGMNLGPPRRRGHRRPFAYASTASMDGRHQFHVYDRETRLEPEELRVTYDKNFARRSVYDSLPASVSRSDR